MILEELFQLALHCIYQLKTALCADVRMVLLLSYLPPEQLLFSYYSFQVQVQYIFIEQPLDQCTRPFDLSTISASEFKASFIPMNAHSLSSNFEAIAWKTSDHKGLFVACSVIACFTPQWCTGSSKNPANHSLTLTWSSHFFCSFIRVAYASSSVRTQRSSNLSAVPSWRVSSLWQGVSGFRWSRFLCETLGYFHGWPVVYVFNARWRSSSSKLHTTWLQCKCTANTTANSSHVN